MVNIAIAGASGEVAQEVTDVFLKSGKYDLVLLTRRDVPAPVPDAHSRWVHVDYADLEDLTKVLHGIEVVLSSITPQTDPGNMAQRNLIDAAIGAGVKRFASSEWATSRFDYMPWYAGKAEIREYLKKVNKPAKVLEYTLFQPGLFLNYFSHPYSSAKYMSTLQTQIDFHNRRAIAPKDCENAKITLTTVQDLASTVAKVIEYKGEWPVTGGIKGCELSIAELLQLAENIRGGHFRVEELDPDDLKAGIIDPTWLPKLTHAAIPKDQADALAGQFLAGMTLSIDAGALNVSDEWNRLFPDYEFTQPREFLTEIWKDKP